MTRDIKALLYLFICCNHMTPLLLVQVESLRHAHDAASSQLLALQEQAEQLEGQVTDLTCQLKSAKGTGFKQEAAIAELLAKHKSNSQSWQQEKQQLQVSATQWRQRAVQLQEEVWLTSHLHLQHIDQLNQSTTRVTQLIGSQGTCTQVPDNP